MRTDELYYFYDQRYTKSKKKEAYYSNRFQKIIRKFHQSPNDALSPVSIIKSFENRHSYVRFNLISVRLLSAARRQLIIATSHR